MTTSCLTNTRYPSINDLVYAYRTQKNPIVRAKKSHANDSQDARAFLSHMQQQQQQSSSGPPASVSRKLAIHQQLFGMPSYATDVLSSNFGSSSTAVPTVFGGQQQEGGPKRDGNNRRGGNNSNSNGNNKDSGKNQPPDFGDDASGSMTAASGRAGSGGVSFGVARQTSLSSRYRMLTGAPTSFSSGGGFMRKSPEKRASLTNAGRGWGQSSSLSAQLAEARASLLPDTMSERRLALASSFNNASPGATGGVGGRQSNGGGVFYQKERKSRGGRATQKQKGGGGGGGGGGAAGGGAGAAAAVLSSSSPGRATKSASARLNLASKPKRKDGRASLRQSRRSGQRTRSRGKTGPDEKIIGKKSSSLHRRRSNRRGGGSSNGWSDDAVPTAPIVAKMSSFLSPLKGAQPRSVGGSTRNTHNQAEDE